jgi:hypothetical protein
VLDALGKTAEIRNKLGESVSTLRRFDIPLEQAIARVSGNRGPFIRAIESLPERFMLLRREDSK